MEQAHVNVKKSKLLKKMMDGFGEVETVILLLVYEFD